MRGSRCWLLPWLFVLLSGCAGRATTETLPSGAVLPDSAKLPSTATLAVYLPSNYRKSRVFTGSAWVLPGKAIEESVSSVIQHYFVRGFLAEPGSEQTESLLLAIHPAWSFDGHDVKMTMKFRVFAKDGAPLLEGEHSYSTEAGDLRSSNSLYNAALRTTQLVVIDVLAKLEPNAQRFPASNRPKDVDPKRYVDHDKPVVSGTGFFVNAAGQVLTAAHVLHDCAMIEVRRNDQVLNTRSLATSALLDLAVVDTGAARATPLPLRKGQDFALGEPVANVGFPLQPLLAATPSLTRGNVSSRGALSGSLGEFQFSAPIQPGSSGGPVVSDGGELLGITLSTLNPKPLIERGILPQNVNFALEARYAAMFLRRNGIVFTEAEPNAKGDMQVGNQAALAAVVSVACYQ